MRNVAILLALLFVFGCKKIKSDIDALDSKASVKLCLDEGEREYFRNLQRSCEEELGAGDKKCGAYHLRFIAGNKYENTDEGQRRKEDCEAKFGS